MPPCRRCWRTWAGEPLRPDCGPQRELDKPSQINYTMNRKSAGRNMASSTFPFKSKRLTAEFVRLGAVNLFCFYRSSREKFSSQHQMPLSQLRRAGSKEQLLPSVPRKLLSESSDIPPFAFRAWGDLAQKSSPPTSRWFVPCTGRSSAAGWESMTTDYAISAVFLEYHIFRRITIYLLIVNPLQTFPLTCGAPVRYTRA